MPACATSRVEQPRSEWSVVVRVSSFSPLPFSLFLSFVLHHTSFFFLVLFFFLFLLCPVKAGVSNIAVVLSTPSIEFFFSSFFVFHSPALRFFFFHVFVIILLPVAAAAAGLLQFASHRRSGSDVTSGMDKRATPSRTRGRSQVPLHTRLYGRRPLYFQVGSCCWWCLSVRGFECGCVYVCLCVCPLLLKPGPSTLISSVSTRLTVYSFGSVLHVRVDIHFAIRRSTPLALRDTHLHVSTPCRREGARERFCERHSVRCVVSTTR